MAASGIKVVAPPRLPHFVMVEKLGQGSYATVYKAFRKGNNREVVAIKCIQKKTLSKSATENLLMEIELLKKLNHSYIVQLKDFQWDDEHIFLIMEYCSGGDLSRFIHSKRALPERVARKFLRQLASALQFLHSHNVAHMDLKPQNLLLSSKQNPVLKLADFGFAQYLHDNTDASNIRGSPLYMAPEMICSQTYDASVDLWSVGVILYETLFGEPPFKSKTFTELEVKIRSSEPIKLPPGAQVSPECRDFLLALLQRDPKQRISFEAFFAHAFIDMEHVPSAESLEKAIKLVTEAVSLDRDKAFKEAAQLYCQAMEYFVPAIEYETDPLKKTHLRERVNDYMGRAEDLKQYLKAKKQPVNGKDFSSAPDKLLAEFAKDNSRLKEALRLAEIAEIRDEHEHYDGALRQYQAALASLLPLLNTLPKGTYRDALRSEIDRYMRRAEEIKLYMKLCQERANSIREAEDESTKSKLNQFLVLNFLCSPNSMHHTIHSAWTATYGSFT